MEAESAGWPCWSRSGGPGSRATVPLSSDAGGVWAKEPLCILYWLSGNV